MEHTGAITFRPTRSFMVTRPSTGCFEPVFRAFVKEEIGVIVRFVSSEGKGFRLAHAESDRIEIGSVGNRWVLAPQDRALVNELRTFWTVGLHILRNNGRHTARVERQIFVNGGPVCVIYVSLVVWFDLFIGWIDKMCLASWHNIMVQRAV